MSEGWCGSGDLNPDGIATASPSSWCVCQFRHFRKGGLIEISARLAGSSARVASLELFAMGLSDLTILDNRLRSYPTEYMAEAECGQLPRGTPTAFAISNHLERGNGLDSNLEFAGVGPYCSIPLRRTISASVSTTAA